MNKKLISLGLALTLVLSLSACGGKQKVGGVDVVDGVTVVKVGVCGSNNEQWDTVNKLLEADKIRCEIVEFSAYNLPNEALNNGDIALNAFQHKAYMNNEIEQMNYDISVLCDTIIAPLALFSDKITDVSQLKAGDKIAVPQDATNEGRCFKILETAGVLKVDPAAGYTPELKDVTDNPLDLEFVEMEAGLTANSLPDVAAAFVNGARAIENGLLIEDAIYVESVADGTDNPYINIIAARTADLKNDVFLKIAAAYQTAETAQAILDVYQGAYIPAFEY